MNNQEQIRMILALQQEVDAKQDELIGRIKDLLQSERARGNHRIVYELDGEIYELTKVDETRQVIDSARKHKGFYFDYRLVRLGKPIR